MLSALASKLQQINAHLLGSVNWFEGTASSSFTAASLPSSLNGRSLTEILSGTPNAFNCAEGCDDERLGLGLTAVGGITYNGVNYSQVQVSPNGFLGISVTKVIMVRSSHKPCLMQRRKNNVRRADVGRLCLRW